MYARRGGKSATRSRSPRNTSHGSRVVLSERAPAHAALKKKTEPPLVVTDRFEKSAEISLDLHDKVTPPLNTPTSKEKPTPPPDLKEETPAVYNPSDTQENTSVATNLQATPAEILVAKPQESAVITEGSETGDNPKSSDPQAATTESTVSSILPLAVSSEATNECPCNTEDPAAPMITRSPPLSIITARSSSNEVPLMRSTESSYPARLSGQSASVKSAAGQLHYNNEGSLLMEQVPGPQRTPVHMHNTGSAGPFATEGGNWNPSTLSLADPFSIRSTAHLPTRAPIDVSPPVSVPYGWYARQHLPPRNYGGYPNAQMMPVLRQASPPRPRGQNSNLTGFSQQHHSEVQPQQPQIVKPHSQDRDNVAASPNIQLSVVQSPKIFGACEVEAERPIERHMAKPPELTAVRRCGSAPPTGVSLEFLSTPQQLPVEHDQWLSSSPSTTGTETVNVVSTVNSPVARPLAVAPVTTSAKTSLISPDESLRLQSSMQLVCIPPISPVRQQRAASPSSSTKVCSRRVTLSLTPHSEPTRGSDKEHGRRRFSLTPPASLLIKDRKRPVDSPSTLPLHPPPPKKRSISTISPPAMSSYPVHYSMSGDVSTVSSRRNSLTAAAPTVAASQQQLLLSLGRQAVAEFDGGYRKRGGYNPAGTGRPPTCMLPFGQPLTPEIFAVQSSIQQQSQQPYHIPHPVRGPMSALDPRIPGMPNLRGKAPGMPPASTRSALEVLQGPKTVNGDVRLDADAAILPSGEPQNNIVQEIKLLPQGHNFQLALSAWEWHTIDDVRLPCVFRNSHRYLAVHMVQMRILAKFPPNVPSDLMRKHRMVSHKMTIMESWIFNTVNALHCKYDYGYQLFSPADDVVRSADVERFYWSVKAFNLARIIDIYRHEMRSTAHLHHVLTAHVSALKNTAEMEIKRLQQLTTTAPRGESTSSAGPSEPPPIARQAPDTSSLVPYHLTATSNVGQHPQHFMWGNPKAISSTASRPVDVQSLTSADPRAARRPMTPGSPIAPFAHHPYAMPPRNPIQHFNGVSHAIHPSEAAVHYSSSMAAMGNPRMPAHFYMPHVRCQPSNGSMPAQPTAGNPMYGLLHSNVPPAQQYRRIS